jgi:demethylmenaquinone methyltransferase/2-methoxy-6-polyprenyl-1,4-benzoquinol methylase
MKPHDASSAKPSRSSSASGEASDPKASPAAAAAAGPSTEASARVTPYGGGPKKEEVAQMFDNIAGRYDFLNRFLSLGIDTLWRKKAVRQLADLQPKRILDVATGTGDLAIATLALDPEEVVGVDISREMLAKGREKLRRRRLDARIRLEDGDSEQLPFADGHFDAVLCAYGVRNFGDLGAGLAEIRRVLRPGGRAVVLEFSRPSAFPIKQLFGLYFRTILPTLGRLVSKDARAYDYLHESVAVFPEGQAFEAELKKAGFQRTACIRLSFGISSIYTADA